MLKVVKLIKKIRYVFMILSYLSFVFSFPFTAANATVPGGNIRPDTPYDDLGDFVGNMIQVVLIIAGLALLAYLLFGALAYLTSAGDKAQLEKAQKTLTYAFLGLVIAVAAFAIIKIVEKVFGIQILGGITFPGP